MSVNPPRIEYSANGLHTLKEASRHAQKIQLVT